MKKFSVLKNHPLSKIILFSGALFAVLFITSFLDGLHFFIPRGAKVTNLIMRSVIIGVTPILLLPLIYRISAAKPIFDSGRNILLHIVLSILFTFLFLIVFQVLFSFYYGEFFFGIGYQEIESILVRQFFSIGSILFFTYWGLVVLLGLNKYYEELGNIKRKSNELESQLELATLSSLRAQLKPHFLFNTLSMVDQMIANDPGTAVKMVDKLEKLLKTTFDRTGSESCTLKEEIDFIKKYLAIETHRFHDRLTVRYAISPATKSVNVPRYLLQPLVENALVHGVGRTMDKCTITIKSEFTGGRLYITVEDDGPGARKKRNQKSKGIGLKNIRERLNLYYGQGARLKVNPVNDHGFTSEISIPYKYLSTDIGASKIKAHKP